MYMSLLTKYILGKVHTCIETKINVDLQIVDKYDKNKQKKSKH